MKDDELMSRIGVAFTCTVTMAVFVLALIKLPVRDAVAAAHFPTLNGPVGVPKLGSHEVTLAPSTQPAPAAVASPTAVPTPAPTAAPAAEPVLVPPPASASASPSSSPRPSPTAHKETATTTYTVHSGDTLFSIARRYGVTVQTLASANSISDTGVVKVGQQLKVP